MRDVQVPPLGHAPLGLGPVAQEFLQVHADLAYAHTGYHRIVTTAPILVDEPLLGAGEESHEDTDQLTHLVHGATAGGRSGTGTVSGSVIFTTTTTAAAFRSFGRIQDATVRHTEVGAVAALGPTMGRW